MQKKKYIHMLNYAEHRRHFPTDPQSHDLAKDKK